MTDSCMLTGHASPNFMSPARLPAVQSSKKPPFARIQIAFHPQLQACSLAPITRATCAQCLLGRQILQQQDSTKFHLEIRHSHLAMLHSGLWHLVSELSLVPSISEMKLQCGHSDEPSVKIMATASYSRRLRDSVGEGMTAAERVKLRSVV